MPSAQQLEASCGPLYLVLIAGKEMSWVQTHPNLLDDSEITVAEDLLCLFPGLCGRWWWWRWIWGVKFPTSPTV